MTRVRVKICGVRTPDEARLAVDGGADAVGLNFYPLSPRYVKADQAALIIRELPPFVGVVGVFAGATTDEIFGISRRLGLHAVQRFADVGRIDSPVFQIVAFRIKERSSLDEIDQYLSKCREADTMPAAILIDSHVEGQFGGTGRTAPWEILKDYRPLVPLILAGGLTPENVAEAIHAVRPFAVDVASGVESAPGHKDTEKVRRFIENAHAASRSL
jgi:phosphoribosylanthranilate isomerase